MPMWFAQVEGQGGFNTRDFIDSLARTPLSQITIIAVVCTVIRLVIFKPLMSTPPHKRTGLYSIMAFLNEASDLLVYAAVFVFMLIRPFVGQTFVIPTGSMIPNLMVGDYIGINKYAYRLGDPKVGDIVVFRPPKNALIDPAKQLDADGDVKVDYIKRCIGAPGDLIELKKNVLYRNGQKVEEPYVHYTKPVFNPQTNDNDYPDMSAEEFKVNQIFYDFKLVKYKDRLQPVMSVDGRVDSSLVPEPLQVPKDEEQGLLSLPAEKIPAGYFLFMGDNRNASHDGRFWGVVPRDRIVGKSEFIWLPVRRISATR